MCVRNDVEMRWALQQNNWWWRRDSKCYSIFHCNWQNIYKMTATCANNWPKPNVIGLKKKLFIAIQEINRKYETLPCKKYSKSKRKSHLPVDGFHNIHRCEYLFLSISFSLFLSLFSLPVPCLLFWFNIIFFLSFKSVGNANVFFPPALVPLLDSVLMVRENLLRFSSFFFSYSLFSSLYLNAFAIFFFRLRNRFQHLFNL